MFRFSKSAKLFLLFVKILHPIPSHGMTEEQGFRKFCRAYGRNKRRIMHHMGAISICKRNATAYKEQQSMNEQFEIAA
jgi:hypothetical protein